MSPRTPKQFEELREEKKALIMDVALELFANVGFHATTINHIAKNAGISKGLMYNYFESKEELLSEIISRSVSEIMSNFDQNRDGMLTEEEFEFFIRKLASLLLENRSIWRLFFQLLMQKEVRELFLSEYSPKGKRNGKSDDELQFVPLVNRIITDYFVRKAERMPASYDPATEMNLFFITLKGLSVTFVYANEVDEELFGKMVDRIVELFR